MTSPDARRPGRQRALTDAAIGRHAVTKRSEQEITALLDEVSASTRTRNAERPRRKCCWPGTAC